MSKTVAKLRVLFCAAWCLWLKLILFLIQKMYVCVCMCVHIYIVSFFALIKNKKEYILKGSFITVNGILQNNFVAFFC